MYVQNYKTGIRVSSFAGRMRCTWFKENARLPSCAAIQRHHLNTKGEDLNKNKQIRRKGHVPPFNHHIWSNGFYLQERYEVITVALLGCDFVWTRRQISRVTGMNTGSLSEMQVSTFKGTQRYYPHDQFLHHRRENLEVR